MLGTLEISRAGRPVSLPAAKQRGVLATLLLQAGQKVSHDQLIERIWNGRPPNDARGALHTHVARLRRALGDGHHDAHRLIHTFNDSYSIELPPGSLDLSTFRELTVRAAGAHDAAGKADLLRRALALWRGPVLADVPSESLHREEVPWVMEERLRAIERWFQLGLQLARHDETIITLKEATADHPYHERLWAQLMIALHKAGRRAEALETYRTIDGLLRKELGIDPTQELVRVHAAILNDDPDSARILDETHPGTPPVSRHMPPALPLGADEEPEPREKSLEPFTGDGVPQQLPSGIASFTGREDELKALDDLLMASDHETSPPIVIATISGMGGVGKTALAVHWAHRAMDRFPDGLLYLDLRGFGPGGHVDPGTALEQLLHALAVPPGRIPARTDARSSMLRSVLAGRRVLMLLDNARDSAQVRPLLPGSHAVVLVTSRSQLRGLAVREGAHHVLLEQFSPAESAALLTRILGPERIGAQAQATEELARSCVHLPLALTIAAEHATCRPGSSLRDLAEEVRDQRTALDTLDTADDHEASLRAVFSWSYRALEPSAARMFRMLSLHPGADVSPPEAAALAGVTTSEARRLLDLLTGRSLLGGTGRDRHRFHDLLHVYAVERSRREDSGTERRTAVRRVLDWYLHTADRAADLLEPTRRRFPLTITHVPADPPVLAGPADAMAWLDDQRANLIAATRLSAEHRWDAHTWRLPHALWRFFFVRGHVRDWIDTHLLALDAARGAGDPRALAETTKNLGFAYWRSGHLSEALRHHGRALVLDQESGDRWGEAKTRNHLGFIYDRSGRFAEALDQQHRSLALYAEVDDRCGQGRALIGIGNAYRQLDQHAASVPPLERALAITRDIGDRWGESLALIAIGFTHLATGRYTEATDHFHQALAITREIGDRWGESLALIAIGFTHLATGRHTEATDHLRQALAITRETGDRWGESLALIAIGFTHLATDRHTEATDHLHQALAITREIDSMGDDGLLEDACRAGTSLGPVHGREAVFSALGLHTRLQPALAREVTLAEPSPCSP
ncbi:AfsR/SARP family transcriptional regulator [Nonomuraea aurantiaca]|uniref:AfsR/SARP family transcriptional regulator n=1 Tax=Nonomuraea aurantiaca TaxID=2878562 RepID=UPI001CD91BB0|nr:BTAD domain-containing putative transcriptional regulator [Nonomuraea aurantiaca]MCA2228463.1 tetratricopeptide repeat protein [Nonomuraea aurantiaca]